MALKTYKPVKSKKERVVYAGAFGQSTGQKAYTKKMVDAGVLTYYPKKGLTFVFEGYEK